MKRQGNRTCRQHVPAMGNSTRHLDPCLSEGMGGKARENKDEYVGRRRVPDHVARFRRSGSY